MTATRIDLEHVVPAGEKRDACTLLAALSGLPKGRIKDAIGHPVLGDPRYGTGNRNTEGLRLSACRLAFHCPFTGARREFSLDTPEAVGEAAPGPEHPA